jgi:hypothetical protein
MLREPSRNVRMESRAWKALRAAARLTDALQVRSRGIYEVSPELVLALRQAVDAIRPVLAQHDRDLMEDNR